MSWSHAPNSPGEGYRFLQPGELPSSTDEECKHYWWHTRDRSSDEYAPHLTLLDDRPQEWYKPISDLLASSTSRMTEISSLSPTSAAAFQSTSNPNAP